VSVAAARRAKRNYGRFQSRVRVTVNVAQSDRRISQTDAEQFAVARRLTSDRILRRQAVSLHDNYFSALSGHDTITRGLSDILISVKSFICCPSSAAVRVFTFALGKKVVRMRRRQRARATVKRRHRKPDLRSSGSNLTVISRESAGSLAGSLSDLHLCVERVVDRSRVIVPTSISDPRASISSRSVVDRIE